MKKTQNSDKRVSLSITIPAYNEEETIATVVRHALKERRRVARDFELVLVDDGSSDRTPAIIDSLQKRYPETIVVVHHRKNKGFSGAMKTCYERASKDFIFLGPADGQFDYNEIRKFIEAIRTKDIVVAYRSYNEESWYRKINSKVFHILARLLFGIRLRELSSCVMYRKSVRDAIGITADPFSCLFFPEFIYKAMKKGYRIGQVPINFYRRRSGVQKGTNPRMIIKTVSEMLRFWWDIQRGAVYA